MLNLPPIPPEMQHLKKDHRGYPVPFMVPIVDGKPNFRFTDQKKQLICMKQKLCGICGNKLNPDFVYFLAGPMGLTNKVSSDPAMHRACAEFSLLACPHLHIQKTQRVEDHVGTPHENMLIPDKPAFIFLVKAYKFKVIIAEPEKTKICKFYPHAAEPYEYKEGVLVKSPLTLVEALKVLNSSAKTI